jgi:hypothetical protein
VDKALVVDASPLILFTRIDRLDLLVSLAKRLVLPEAVIREIEAGSDRDGTADRLKNRPRYSELTIDRLPSGSASGTWEPGSPKSWPTAWNGRGRKSSWTIWRHVAAHAVWAFP